MNRDGIAEPSYSGGTAPPGRGEAHVWRVEVPPGGGRAAARRATREILGAYLALEPDAVPVNMDESGKPRLDAAPAPLSFNLSHSGGLALVAVGAPELEVGIDVERLRPRRDLARLAARWLPAEEAEAVAAAPEGEREAAFYAAWTRFEARAKCTGAGLSGPPPGREVVAVGLEIDPGYAAALATIGIAPTLVQRFEFARLGIRPHG